MQPSIATNTLFYGDNLPILREYTPDESIDLVYLDPPFNSNRNYSVLFRDESGKQSEAQIEAFEDTWHWSQAAEETYRDLVTESTAEIGKAIAALRDLVGTNQVMAYLVMMAARLVELHRVLKPTGSLYLHCDPTSSHYLKLVMDAIFGPTKFRTEIIWKRSTAHSDTKQGRRQHGRVHDVILFYTKGDEWTWNPVYTPYDEEYVESNYKHVEPATGRRYQLDNISGPGGAAKGNPSYEVMGVTRYWRYSEQKMDELIRQGRIIQTKPGAVPRYKRYLDEMPGVPLQDLWTDIGPLSSQASERLGYPTQKPMALLERIINTSSNAGDVVLDPFCGCGTAIAAAQNLERKWIGIDITHLSVALMKYRLEDMYPGVEIRVVGEPEDMGGARQLAQDDRYQFQWWALSRIRAKPLGANKAGGKTGKKGADQGIDGIINFFDGGNTPKRVLVQVKSGKVSSRDIRDLLGTLDREKAQIGVFLTLEEPSGPMRKEAVSAGYYRSQGWGRDFPRACRYSRSSSFSRVLRSRCHPSTVRSGKRRRRGRRSPTISVSTCKRRIAPARYLGASRRVAACCERFVDKTRSTGRPLSAAPRMRPGLCGLSSGFFETFFGLFLGVFVGFAGKTGLNQRLNDPHTYGLHVV